MGKQTNAILKTLCDATNPCMQTAANMVTVLAAWHDLNAEWNKWVDEMRKMKNWEDHPYAKSRDAAWTKGKQLLNKLNTEAHAMTAALIEFKEFVRKKEKSHVPFKSKKSLPSSKETIRYYESALDEIKQLVKEGYANFA